MKKVLDLFLLLLLPLVFCSTVFAACIEGSCVNGQGTYIMVNGTKYVGEWKEGKLQGQGTLTYVNGTKYVGEFKDNQMNGQGTLTYKDGKKYIGEFQDNWYHGQGTLTYKDGRKYIGEFRWGEYHGQGTLTYVNGRIDNGIWSFGKLVESIKAEAKKEPKKKEKKIVKKEKKVDLVQKDKDTDPPIIEIPDSITVNNQAYTIKGKVKDKNKQIYLTINGKPVEVKRNGSFEVERFNTNPEGVEELKIVAIDQWNNKSEKNVKVTVQLKATEVAKSYEPLKPNKLRGYADENKIAIIIGIEKYENLPNLDASFANRDAGAFREYANRALGVKPSNIKLLIDKKASKSQTLQAFKLWLPRIADTDGKDIYVFFAGHGLTSDDGEDLYILPEDGHSSLLEDTAIKRSELISLIQKVNPKSVTMFFDTCYSGQTRDEQMLLASLRPIRIVADDQEAPNNFTIFTASKSDQTSGSIKEAKQGMFSYYLMKGFEGKADNNQDKQITNGELIAYLQTHVSKEAFNQNREQDPMFSGDPDQILMRYK